MVIEVLQKENERQRNIGIKQGLIETAKKMLKRNMNMDDIQDITGLTKNELEKLKK